MGRRYVKQYIYDEIIDRMARTPEELEQQRKQRETRLAKQRQYRLDVLSGTRKPRSPVRLPFQGYPYGNKAK